TGDLDAHGSVAVSCGIAWPPDVRAVRPGRPIANSTRLTHTRGSRKLHRRPTTRATSAVSARQAAIRGDEVRPVSALMGRPPTDMWLHTTPQRFATRNDWQDNICSAFVPLEIRAPRSEPFHNLTANRTLGHINISELVTSAQQVRRTPALAARSEQASYKFSIQLSGQSQVTQDGRSTLLKSGDW